MGEAGGGGATDVAVDEGGVARGCWTTGVRGVGVVGTTMVFSADRNFDEFCAGKGGGGGVSDSIGGSWGVMSTGIESCLGSGDIGCCCCCCQDGVKTGALGDG